MEMQDYAMDIFKHIVEMIPHKPGFLAPHTLYLIRMLPALENYLTGDDETQFQFGEFLKFNKEAKDKKPYFTLATFENSPEKFDISVLKNRDTIFNEEAFNNALSKEPVAETVKKGHKNINRMVQDPVAQKLKEYSKPLWRFQEEKSTQQQPILTNSQKKKLRSQQRKQEGQRQEIPEIQEEEFQEPQITEKPRIQQHVIQKPQRQELELEIREEEKVDRAPPQKRHVQPNPLLEDLYDPAEHTSKQQSKQTRPRLAQEEQKEEVYVSIPKKLQNLYDLLNDHQTWTKVSFEDIKKAWTALKSQSNGFRTTGNSSSHFTFHTPFGLSFTIYHDTGDSYPRGYLNALRNFIEEVIAHYQKNPSKK